MSSAQLRVQFAGPLVTIQDAGRFGQSRYGVCPSGPMDRNGLAIANAALGQDEATAGLEVSLGGLVLECKEGSVTLAIAGGGFSIDCAGVKSTSWGVHRLHSGQKLTLRGGAWGSWAYVAFAGALASQPWLGSHATHSMTGYGGGVLQSGQILEVAETRPCEDRLGDIPCPAFAQPTGQAHVVVGPQDQHFAPASVQRFLSEPYQLTKAFDRMGARLSGPTLDLSDALSIPSEPILRGSVQVSGDGVPTVLLSDHQTTGGYPKVATVVGPDIDRLAQMRATDRIRFHAITAQDAVALARKEAKLRRAYLDELAQPRLSLNMRLLQENLISGVISGAEELES